MSAKLNYDPNEIRFDIPKEERVSVEDSRQLICVDVDKVGSGYRTIVNGCEFELPAWVGTMADAKKIALELAAKSIHEALNEIAEQA